MIRRLVPHFIQQNYAQGNSRGSFRAAGLFMDISGFSAMTDALMMHGPHGAEIVAEVMRGVFEPLAESISAYGGFITSLAGDAFTALYPQERFEPGSLLPALAAAREMQQYMLANSERKTPYGSFEMRAKIGLAIGEVNWGIVTHTRELRAVYYFQGSAVDGCAQAEHHSNVGEVIITPELVDLLPGLIDFEPVGQYFRLLGIKEPPQPEPYPLPAPDLEVMKYFYPELLFTMPYSGEFRTVLSLFINLPTVRNENQLASFMQTVFEMQDRYGGLLNRLDFGDKGSNLLFFWGAPVTLEDDVERGLDFIVSLQEMTSIPINAGITLQLAHAGFVGSPLLEDFTCSGRGVSLAARFMVAAPRGEIWVDQQVVRRARGMFDFDLEGQLTFKGFNDPQQVYVLLERKEQVESYFAGKMTGRKEELDRLADFVLPLWQGRFAGGLVVRGEAGMGKSRLLHEFRDSDLFQADSNHLALWAVCQTDDILRESLNPFRYWLQSHFGQVKAQTEARNKRTFNRALDLLIESTGQVDPNLADELDRVRSFLGALVNLHWPDSLYEQVDPQGRYDNTLIGLSVLLQAESLQQPVILLLEDAHGFDDDTRLFLPRLVRTLTADGSRSYPIAILMTSRHEKPEALLGEDYPCQEIHLYGLSLEALKRVAESTLGGALSGELIGLLAERSEGNPFFAGQILLYMQDQQLLEPGDDGWQVKPSTTPALLPIDVGTLLVARLDRLVQEVKKTVQSAAVLGREFEFPVLSWMLIDDEDLLQKVNAAEVAGIWTSLGELRYLFQHILLRDAAYGMLLLVQRQSLHALAAEALEVFYTDDLRPYYGELAYHCEQAQAVDKARRYLRLAGDAAKDDYRNSLAVEYYTRALNLTSADELEARCDFLLEREALFKRLGNSAARLADLKAASELAQQINPPALAEDLSCHQALVVERWSDYFLETGQYAEAILYAMQAEDTTQANQEWEAAISAYLTWAMALLRLGKYKDGVNQAQTCLELTRKIGDLEGQSRALNMLGLIHFESMNFPDARRNLEESLRIAREVNNLRIQAMSLNNLARLAEVQGDYSTARHNYLNALEMAREIGDRAQETIILANLGFVAGSLGDFQAAMSYCEQNLRINSEIGDPYAKNVALINLSAFAGRQGDNLAALAYASQGLELAKLADDPNWQAWALTYLGHAQAQLDQVEEAKISYFQAVDIRHALDQPNLAMEPIAGLARLALKKRDLKTALGFVETILAGLEKPDGLYGTDEPFRIFLTCIEVLDAVIDPRANQVLANAYNLLQEQAEKISDPAARKNFQENIPFHRSIREAWGEMVRLG